MFSIRIYPTETTFKWTKRYISLSEKQLRAYHFPVTMLGPGDALGEQKLVNPWTHRAHNLVEASDFNK